MATAPHQRKIIIHREKCERDFLQIKKENWFAANKDLEPYGLQVYLYLAGNRDGFILELSQEAAEREAGIKKTSFHKYVNLMIEKGYLVQRGEGSNIYDFYERPQEKKKKEAKPSGELDSLRAGHDERNCDSPDELLSLLSEFEDSQDKPVSSQRSKEIYNKGDTSQNKKINSDDVFVFQINGLIRIIHPPYSPKIVRDRRIAILLRSRNSGVRAKVANAKKSRREVVDMQPDQSTLLSRRRGTLPDKYWYQLNGKSAQENYQAQKEKMYAELTEEDDELYIVSEVKLK